MKRISIDPITRLEGHGKIEIFLNDDGSVANCYFQVPELRGFEKFIEGMPIEEVPRVVSRICGVCPASHHLAAGKAVDAVYKVDPPPAAKKLRELYYSAHYFHSHIAHFYALAAPDFVVGPDADPAKRNILGIVEKVGIPVAAEVLKHRAIGQDIQIMVGGRSTHPVWTLPGGVSKGITEEQRTEIIEKAKSCVEFAKFSLKLFEDVVLSNKTYLDIILSDIYELDTYWIGTVDEKNLVNFYHGDHRVVDQKGKEVFRYKDHQYLDYIAEHVEKFTYLKFPYLKKIGWKGFVDGPDSGLYQATPLSRLNAADGMATPLAQTEYEKMYKTLGGKPVKKLMATHWARLVELLYAAERLLELAQDPEITSPNFRTLPTQIPEEGVGIVEAMRGILTHHYKTDKKGLVTEANLIVGTTNNHAPISMSIKRAAQKLIQPGKEIGQGLLNMVEMAFRLYDPCFSCATHSLPGEMPLVVVVKNAAGEVIRKESRP
ncbi:MAG: Ni/Fe hydrogenase subunit alpha [Acidobacteriota bacterium]|jgi:F420-non-reducing hydrogenase large subunit